MIDLDAPDTNPEILEHATKVWYSTKTICKPHTEYNEVAIYKRVVRMKGNCDHERPYVQVVFLELPDGTGALTALTAATLEDAKKTKCEECYIKEYANYTEIHGFPVFVVGTIEQMRYANKIRAKAHAVHQEKTSRAINLITEPGWWLDNSSRMRHAKIWREVEAVSDDQLIEVNNIIKARREKQEEQRFARNLREEKLKNKS